MTQFFNDTFSVGSNVVSTSHTTDSGHTWLHWEGATPDPMVYSTLGGVVGAGVGGGQAIRSSIIAPTEDVDISGSLYVGNATTGFSYGILARANVGGTAAYLAAWLPASTKWAIFRVGAAMATTQLGIAASTSSHPNNSTPTYEFIVSGTGATVTLELWIDGALVVSATDTDAARITSAGYVGLWFSATSAGSGMFFGSVSASDVSAGASISITTPVDGKINQRSGTSGTVSVTGAYTGTPTSIEARLVADGTNTPVSGFDWATKVASPSGSAYSFDFTSVPQGGWYNVQVRHSNDTAVNATSSKVGVGALFVVDGQSNAWNWFATTAYAGDSSLTPDTKLRIAGIQPTAWDVPAAATMNGAIACGNALVAALGIPVGLIDGTWNGSGLTVSGSGGQWISGGAAGNAYTASAAAISAETSAIEGSAWIQGEADSGASVTQSAYYTALGQMIALRRTAVGNASSTYVVALLGRDTSGSSTDAKRQAINLALDQKCGDANVYRVERYDLPLHTDGIHHTAAGYTALGQRVARAFLAAIGNVSTYRGPRITSVLKISGAVFDVTLTHSNGSDFTPTSGITGWRVTDGGTPVTVSTAVRTAANTVRLTLASSPSALPVVQYEYGMAPDVTGVLKDNSALTLPLEFNSGVTATATTKTATIRLVNEAGSPLASLAGIKWAWYDTTTPDGHVAPTDKGAGETTDASGYLQVLINNSALSSGGIGSLEISTSDGTTTQSPSPRGWAGPVAVD